MSPARRYFVDPAAYYRLVPPAPERVAAAMAQLIKAYGLAGKEVASIGCGSATEECHFLSAGCRIALFDIDEQHSIEKRLRASEVQHETGMTFHIGDFFALAIGDHRQRYDVVYSSGFLPDEGRRYPIAQRAVLDAGNLAHWTAEKPFHPDMLTSCAAMLRETGLLIVQSYYGGVDHRYHKGYLPACELQLCESGLRLLDVYAFASTVGIKLFVSVKGDRAVQRDPLTTFHGRAETAEPIERIICR